MVSPSHSSAIDEGVRRRNHARIRLTENHHDLLNLLGRFAGARNRTEAYQGRAHFGDFFLGL